MIYEIHPNRMTPPPTRKKKSSPIADIFPVSDIGASDIDTIMQAARAFPQIHAYDSPDGKWIAIATEKPTETQFKKFLKTTFGYE